jgi:hypothetical protein
MAIIGFILSLVSGSFMLIGLIPFLGWLNWITTLPLAVAGGVFSGLGITRAGGIKGFGIAGLIISILVFFVAVNRLILGCGVF